MTSGGLAAVSSSFFAALCSAFGKYDVVHIHAEGPAFFAWLPKMFGKRVVVRDDADKRLVGVYIDITGNKEIYKRPEMVHLLKDCKKGAVNLIFSQTRAYLAANTC